MKSRFNLNVYAIFKKLKFFAVIPRAVIGHADIALAVNASSIVYVSHPTEQKIYWTDHISIVFLGVNFRSAAKEIDPFVKKRSRVNCLELGSVISSK